MNPAPLEGIVLKSLIFSILLIVNFVLSPAQAAEVPVDNRLSQYSENALMLTQGPEGYYRIFLRQRPLSAIQLSHLFAEQSPAFRTLEKQLRQQHAGKVAGGVLLGLVGGAATLFSGLYLGFSIMWASPVASVLFVAGLGVGVSLIYGGYVLASKPLQPHRVWSQSEANTLVKRYNAGLLKHLSRRSFPIRVRFAIRGSGFGLIGKF